MTVTLVDMESGETFSLVGLGSGQDSGDKAVMKAQTASMKYAYLLSLAISTGDDPEADAQTDEHSNGAQVRAIREFAKGHNIIIVDQYIDRARSATTDDRPAFQQMIEDSAKGNFEIVLVHKLDRFARNRNDSSVYRLKLHKNKVKLLSVMEPLDDERPESIILQSTLEAMAEYYSINLAREVRKGMKENALKAKHTGGRPSLGYDVDRVTKELVINENEAAAVRLICLQRQVAEVEQKEGNLLSLLAPRQGQRKAGAHLARLAGTHGRGQAQAARGDRAAAHCDGCGCAEPARVGALLPKGKEAVPRPNAERTTGARGCVR